MKTRQSETIKFNSSVIKKIKVFQIEEYHFLKIYFLKNSSFYYYEIDKEKFPEIIQEIQLTNSIGKTYTQYIKGKFKTWQRADIKKLYQESLDKKGDKQQSLNFIKNEILRIDSEIKKLQLEKDSLLAKAGEIVLYN